MKTLGLLCLLFYASCPLYAEIDLTPTETVRELEGCKFPQLEFRDGGKKITYEPPAGWRYVRAGQHALSLIPKNKALASAKIEYVAAPGPLVLDEQQLQHLKDSAPTFLPAESSVLEEPTISPNPLSLNGHATCELDVLFLLHSERLHMSVLLVDLGDSQLRFSLTSQASDFTELHKLFRQSWFSWQWLDLHSS